MTDIGTYIQAIIAGVIGGVLGRYIVLKLGYRKRKK